MQDVSSLGKATVVDHGLQGAPLIEGYAGSLHIQFLCSLKFRCAIDQSANLTGR